MQAAMQPALQWKHIENPRESPVECLRNCQLRFVAQYVLQVR